MALKLQRNDTVEVITGSDKGKRGRVLRYEIDLQSKYLPLWAVDSAQSSFVSVVETAPTATLKLLVEADAAGMALLTDARAGNFAYVRFAAANGTNSLQIDTAVKHMKPDPYTDQDGVYAIGWNLELAHDATWGTSPGKAMTVSVVNGVSGL